MRNAFAVLGVLFFAVSASPAQSVKEMKEKFLQDPDLVDRWHRYERENPRQAERIKQEVRERIRTEEREGPAQRIEPQDSGRRDDLGRYVWAFLRLCALVLSLLLGLVALVRIGALIEGIQRKLRRLRRWSRVHRAGR